MEARLASEQWSVEWFCLPLCPLSYRRYLINVYYTTLRTLLHCQEEAFQADYMSGKRKPICIVAWLGGKKTTINQIAFCQERCQNQTGAYGAATYSDTSHTLPRQFLGVSLFFFFKESIKEAYVILWHIHYYPILSFINQYPILSFINQYLLYLTVASYKLPY